MLLLLGEAGSAFPIESTGPFVRQDVLKRDLQRLLDDVVPGLLAVRVVQLRPADNTAGVPCTTVLDLDRAPSNWG